MALRFAQSNPVREPWATHTIHILMYSDFYSVGLFSIFLLLLLPAAAYTIDVGDF